MEPLEEPSPRTARRVIIRNEKGWKVSINV
jgi:hypothetical protein